jgi:hypothetical protein
MKHISPNCIKAYQLLFKLLQDYLDNGNLVLLKQFAIIFQKQMTGENAVNFELDLANMKAN